jgi:hypothetical protein
MSKNNRAISFDKTYESIMTQVIGNPKTRRIFEDWERIHLRDLTRTNKSYKFSSKPSFKAKVISETPETARRSLYEKLAPMFDVSAMPDQEGIDAFCRSVASDLLLSDRLTTLEDHSQRFYALYPGLLERVLSDLSEIDYAQKSLEFAGKELIEADELTSSYVDPNKREQKMILESPHQSLYRMPSDHLSILRYTAILKIWMILR